MTFRKKPGVAFWTIVVLVVVLTYPLSIGPLTWLVYHGFVPDWSHGPIQTIYAPLAWMSMKDGPSGPEMNAFGKAIGWYGSLWFN